MNIDFFTTKMRDEFLKGQSRIPAINPAYEKFTTEHASDARIEDLAWMGASPGIQLYEGHRRYGNADFGQFIIVNRPYDAAIRVPARAIRDDKIGGYPIMFNDLGMKAKMYPGVNVMQMLNAGTSTLCYDGTNFFANAHNQGGGTPGSALPSPFNTNTSGLNLLNYTSANTSDGNTFKAVFMLTYETIKPANFQWRLAPTMGTNSGAPESSENQEVRFWVDMELASFPGLWQSAVMVNITNTPNLTDMQVIVDQVIKQFRSFTLPVTSPGDPLLYVHNGLKINSDVGICVCSTGLETLLNHLFMEERIGVSVAGSTAGFTNNIYRGKFDLIADGYLNSANGT